MEQNVVLDLARQGMTVALMVSLPILAVALFVGLLVSVFQAVTQVQEMTLTYVPKIIGVGLVIMFFGSWMLTTLVSFTRLCFEYAARVMIG
ncbi:MAG: flagellar biosynthesis protein FliQ [Fimbriimonadaceae bacterium]|nr:flagellar biosynthesis protein FliQ [Fimbriimonadaceae bacterium]